MFAIFLVGAIKAERSEFFRNFFFYWRAVDHLNILCYRLDLALKMTFFEIQTAIRYKPHLRKTSKVLKMAKYLFVCFQSQVYVNSFLDGNFLISQDMWWSRIGFIISIGANQNRNPRPRRPKQLLHQPLSLLSSRGLTVNSSSRLDVSLWSTNKPLAKNCF